MPRKASKIVIREAWCKGCAICVAVCPKKVLVMNRFKAKVADLDKCIVCGRCEDACPDFCLEVIPQEIENQE